MRVHALRCEHFREALGIDIAAPRFSWLLESGKREARQTGYRLRVARSVEALAGDGASILWDSGRVDSDQSVLVPYGGPALGSGERAYWTVTVWDETDTPTDADEPAWWEMGLLARDDWKTAEWIGSNLVGGPQTTVPCPYLRKTFTVGKPVTKARLYATALGLYECHLNGAKVGDDDLTPGWTDYNIRVQYQTCDVTTQIGQGENVLGAILGDGWYCGHVEWRGRQRYGDRPKLLALLVLTYEDGTTETIATDNTWKFAFGPLVEADLLMGESYDARLELHGWDSPGFDDAAWLPAVTCNNPGIELTAQQGPTVKATEELPPVTPPGEIKAQPLVVDFGQNLVGRIRVRMRGKVGQTVRFRFAEVLKAGPTATTGPIYTDNLRQARQTDNYTLRGDEDGETFETRFTFHGFRFVEISGFPDIPEIEEITAVVLHSDIPKTGDFTCSDPLINQLQKNIDWGQRGNYVDIPTDCPQRDERLGWTGDAQVFVRTAAFNRDIAGFFRKWLQDLRDAQGEKGEFPSVAPNTAVVPGDGGPAWADAGVICPWTIYLCYGDKRFLEESYDSMRRFLAYLEETSREYIRCYDGYPGFTGFGDWLALDGGLGNVQGRTPKDLVGTAFFAYSARLIAQVARALGKPEDEAKYLRLFANIREAFQRRFVTESGLIASDSQTAYVLALYFDLLEPGGRAVAGRELVRDIRRRGMKLSTGFTSSHYLPHVLTETGHLDIAYNLLHQKGWPSWLYAVTQGATTIWERWDAWTPDKGYQDPGMNSFNHYAYGAVGAWLYGSVAGIDADPDAPGYKHIVLRPHPGGGLSHAGATLHSPYGVIESAWHTGHGGGWEWNVTIPPNATATAYLPCEENALIAEEAERPGLPVESAKGVTMIGREGDTTLFRLQSGTYRFVIAPSNE